MKKIRQKYWLGFWLLFSLLPAFAESEPLLQQIGRDFFQGILQSNYREVPLNQFISLKRLPLAEIRYPASVNHPSLLFDTAAINKIRSRRTRQPYQTWLNNMITSALSSSYDPTSPFISEKIRARMAKINAFCWFLTDQKHFKQEAVSALTNITEIRPPANGEGGIPGVGWGDWMEAADALQSYAVAYDLLYHELSADERKSIELMLATKIAQIHKYYVHIPSSTNPTDITLGLGIPKNNHIIQIAVGVATASLVIDHPRSAVWFEDSIREMQAGLALIMSDGSYQEGPYYARFINYHLYPFFFYLKNVCRQNLFNHPAIQKLNTWLIDLELPNGSLPLIADSFDDILLYKPIGVGLSPQESELRYLFENQIDRYRPSDPNWVESFCAFNDRIRPRKPDHNAFYPEGGYAILRGNNDIVGTLVGQPGRPQIAYHGHINPSSFTFYAFGHHWLIDGGYGPKGVNDKNRNWFISARSHNMPLVNGLGPDQNPIWGDELKAEMPNSFRLKNLTASAVRASYQDAEIRRNVWLINQDFFLVYDHLSSPSINRYTIPWHSLGQFQAFANRAVWRQEDAELQAEFISLEAKPFVLSQRVGLNTHKSASEHSVAEISFFPSEEVKLVSLFLPQSASDELQSENLAVNSQGRASGRTISNEYSTTRIIMAESIWQQAEIESDADLAIIQQNISETVITVKAATFFKFEGAYIFSSDIAVDLTLNLQKYMGYLAIGDKMPTISFFLSFDPGIVILGRRTLDYQMSDDALIIKPDRCGALQFGRLISEIETAEPPRTEFPVLERLSSSFYPEREFQRLSHYEKTQLQNEIIGIAAPQTLSAANQIIGTPNMMQNLYYLFSGLLGKSYSDTENFVFRLPQSFKIERKLGIYRIKYYEEGLYTSAGMKIYRQRLWAGNREKKLYYSYDKDFNGYQIHSLQMNYRRYYSRADWQTYASKNIYLLELQRNHSDGFVEIAHQQNEMNESIQNHLTLAQGNLQTNINHNRQNDSNEYNFALNSTGQKLSFYLDSRVHRNSGINELNVSNSYLLSSQASLNININLREQTADREYVSSLRSSLAASIGKLNNTIEFTNDLMKNNALQNRTALRLKKWQMRSTIKVDSLWQNEIDIAFRQQNFSTRFNWQRSNLLEWEGNICLNCYWSIQAATTWDWDESSYKKVAGGFFYNDRQRVATNFIVKKDSDKYSFGLATTLELSLIASEILIFSSEFFWKEDGKLDSYLLDITQAGKIVTPGILIKRSEDRLLRCEGYLLWRF